jgi:hypothetical protein
MRVHALAHERVHASAVTNVTFM